MSSNQQQKKENSIRMQKNKIQRIKDSIKAKNYYPKTKSQMQSELKLAEKRLDYLKTHNSPPRPTRKAPVLPRQPNTSVRRKSPTNSSSRKKRKAASDRHQRIARINPEEETKRNVQTQCNKNLQAFKKKYKIFSDTKSQESIQKFNKQQEQRENDKTTLSTELNKHENCKNFVNELNKNYENKIIATLRHGLWMFIRKLPTSAKNFVKLNNDLDNLQPGPKSLHKFLKKFKTSESLIRFKKDFEIFDLESKKLMEYYTGKMIIEQHKTEFNLQKEHVLKIKPFVKTTIYNLEKRKTKMKEAKEFANNFIKSLNIVVRHPNSLTSNYLQNHKEISGIKKRLKKK